MGILSNPTHQDYRSMLVTLSGPEDLKGNLYCGISLQWDCTNHQVDLTMVQYVVKHLIKYNHVAPLKPQHCLYLLNSIKFGKDNQAPTPLDESPLLDKVQK
jgi:hypothetical protein